MGQHFYGIPVESPPKLRCKRRGEPSVHLGPRWGIERGGKRQAVSSGADHGTGIGVRSGGLAVVRIMCGPHVKTVWNRGVKLLPHVSLLFKYS